jgi:hypothetical protein
MKLLFLTCAAFALCICGAQQLRGQTTANLSATIQFSNGQTVALDDFSDLVGVQPGEVVTVTIQFASKHAGEAIEVGSLDGGWIGNASSAVSGQGLVTFRFQAPANYGQIRISVRHGLRTLHLLFWVLSSNPENNPPVVTPANQ